MNQRYRDSLHYRDEYPELQIPGWVIWPEFSVGFCAISEDGLSRNYPNMAGGNAPTKLFYRLLMSVYVPDHAVLAAWLQSEGVELTTDVYDGQRLPCCIYFINIPDDGRTGVKHFGLTEQEAVRSAYYHYVQEFRGVAEA